VRLDICKLMALLNVWWDIANNFALLLIWINLLIGYPIYLCLILLHFFNQWDIDTFEVSLNFYQLTSWSFSASDLFTGSCCQPLVWLDKCLECCSRFANTRQAMYGFSFFSISPYFCSWWFSLPFFKDLHIHLCDQWLGPFPVIDKVG
jgi:hypothetical protein